MPEHDEDQTDRVFRDAYAVLMERAPIAPTLEEITAIVEASSRVTSLLGHPHQEVDDSGPGNQTLDRTVESDKPSEEGSKVEIVWEDVERPAPSETGRWSGVAIAVAAAILVVVGVVVVADGNGGGVATEPVSSQRVSVPAVTAVPGSTPISSDYAAAIARVTDPVTDPPAVGCEIPQGWAQVCDAASFDGAAMYAVTAGGPGLVAVGGEGLQYYTREEVFQDCCVEDSGRVERVADAVVWTSPDGLTWSRVPHDETVFGGNGHQSMLSVTAGGPGLVAVGTDGPVGSEDVDGAVWTSPDGLTWSRVPHDEAVFGGPGEQRMVSVTAGGPGLVAVGFDGSADVDGAVWTSPDGFTWTRVPHDETVFGGDSRQMMLDVTVGGPGLVAVGTDGHLFTTLDESAADAAVWTSADGLTWSRVPRDEEVFGGPTEQRMVSVTVGGPGLVAVGFECGPGYSCSDAAVWTSPDGFNWSRVPDDEAIFSSSGALGDQNEAMLSVIAGGPGLVAVGFDSIDDCGWDSAVWTSPDGFAWSRVPDERNCSAGPYDRMLSVTVGPSGLVAVGEEHSPGGGAAVWNR